MDLHFCSYDIVSAKSRSANDVMRVPNWASRVRDAWRDRLCGPRLGVSLSSFSFSSSTIRVCRVLRRARATVRRVIPGNEASYGLPPGLMSAQFPITGRIEPKSSNPNQGFQDEWSPVTPSHRACFSRHAICTLSKR